MKDLRFLVTGASGFLGTRLCDRLLASGAEVHATSRSQREYRNGRLRWWQTDLLEYAGVHRLFNDVRPDVVVHLAGQVTAAPDLSLVLPVFHSQLGGTLNVLVAATERGCRRVITTGSLTEPTISDLKPTPSSPYAAAKWSSTAYARMFHSLYDTPVVVLRPFMTYGPRQHETKIVPYVVNSLLRRKAPELSSGAYSADWVYIDDVIDAFVTAATRLGIDGCDIDLGSGQLTSLRHVVDLIVQRIGPVVKPQFGAVPDRPNEQMHVANTEYTRAVLGWSAGTSLEDGLAATIEWHRSQLNCASTSVASQA
jgi:nucleoside-diphosphate-sugar epimerase